MNHAEDRKHTGAERAIDKLQDATAGAVGKTAAAAGAGSTKAFVENAARGDRYEILASELALDRARSPEVRKIAEEIIHDHRQASQELQAAVQAAAPDLTPPSDLDNRRQGMLDNLKAAPDEDFDKTYVDQQLAAHEEAVTLFNGYRDRGDDGPLKAFAAKTAPVLERHRAHVERVRGQL